MNIAMLSPFFFPHVGGTERYILDLSRELVALGHEVTVFTHTRGPGTVQGIAARRLKSVWLPYTPLLYEFPTEELASFDILHAHAPPYKGIEKAYRVGRPLIVTFHLDVIMPKRYKGLILPRFFRRVVEQSSARMAKRFLGQAMAVVVTTESYAETSPTLRGIKPVIIPMGIKTAVLKAPAAKSRRPRFLFVGRLAASKGVDVLIEATACLRKSGDDFEVEIIGSGEEEAVLKRKAAKLGLEAVVRFSGVIRDDSYLRNAYAAADALVLPSIGHRLESFGIVQIEAMRDGTPVIASDLPGVKEPVLKSGCGLLVEPANPAALCSAMREVIKNRSKWTRMGRTARRFVAENHDIRQTAQSYVDLYQKSLSG